MRVFGYLAGQRQYSQVRNEDPPGLLAEKAADLLRDGDGVMVHGGSVMRLTRNTDLDVIELGPKFLIGQWDTWTRLDIRLGAANYYNVSFYEYMQPFFKEVS